MKWLLSKQWIGSTVAVEKRGSYVTVVHHDQLVHEPIDHDLFANMIRAFTRPVYQFGHGHHFWTRVVTVDGCKRAAALTISPFVIPHTNIIRLAFSRCIAAMIIKSAYEHFRIV